MEFILQQIAFGVKHSGHAVELVKDLVNRMNDSDIAEMGKLFAARLVGSDPSSEPTPEPVDVPVVTPEVEPVTNAAESVS